MLYTENLLVRINISGPMFPTELFECGLISHGFTILGADGYAKDFTHHVMEVSLLREMVTTGEEILHPRKSHCFIVTNKELPRFCMKLLKHDADQEDELSIEVKAKNEHAAAKFDSTETKDEASTIDELKDQNYKGSTKKDAAMGNTSVTATRLPDTNTMSPLIQQLLEPFRSLHSLGAVHIQAPINNQYKTDLIASMCGPGLSGEQLFNRVFTAYEDAMTTYHAGHTSSAITKLKKANDTMKYCKQLSRTAQRDPGASPWDACEDFQFHIWNSLAWATMKNRNRSANVQAASSHVQRLIQWYLDHEWDWPKMQRMRHDLAMLFYLSAEVNEASNNLSKEENAGHDLGIIVSYLKEGLRIEPGNKLLEQQLRKKEEEKRNVEEIEDLMGISDRIEEGKGVGEDSEDTGTTA